MIFLWIVKKGVINMNDNDIKLNPWVLISDEMRKSHERKKYWTEVWDEWHDIKDDLNSTEKKDFWEDARENAPC
jgi:hypothetical protein